MRPKILLVEDNGRQAELTKANLEDQGFDVLVAHDGVEATVVAWAARPAAIVSDVLMPRKDGFELCWTIRQDPGLSNVPVILTTAAFASDEARAFAFQIGADAFVDKRMASEEIGGLLTETLERSDGRATGRPSLTEGDFYAEHPARLVSLSMQEAAVLESEREVFVDAYQGTLQALVSALDARDTGAGKHSNRVAEYALALANRLGVTEAEKREVVRGALVCDLGDIALPDRIFSKRGALSAAERDRVRSHPEMTRRIIEKIGAFRGVVDVVLAHHERWDGTGYPKKIGGEDIPRIARILAVADALEAISSDRPYRAARPFHAALQELSECSGTQFDPEVVDAALEIEPEHWASLKDQAESAAPRELMPGYL
jgi:response regulator RpfG family c-di-GMP phosphodiesterase